MSAAYDVLGDETKRAEYDEVRRLGPMGGGRRAAARAAASRSTSTTCSGGGLGDLLGQMFGRGRGGGGAAAARGVGPRRGADVTRRADARLRRRRARASTTTLHLTTDAQCSTCHGSGAKPGTHAQACARSAAAAASIDDNQGLFSFSSPCRALRRRGHRHRGPVPDVPRHAASRSAPARCRRRIPAGVTDGQTIRLKGRGAPGPQRRPGRRPARRDPRRPAPPVRAQRQRPHRRACRSTFAEAALGGDIDVPTLDGPTVTLRLKPGTQTGQPPPRQGQGHRRPRRAPAT